MFGRKVSNKDLLIFLDIDGVLNTLQPMYVVRPKNVSILSEVIDKLTSNGFTCKIVLTSTWRLGFSKDITQCSPQVTNLINELKKYNIVLHDKTPIYKDKTRDVEIKRFIREYALNNTDFTHVVLDDDLSIFDKSSLDDINLYKVNQNTGLVAGDVAKIVKQVKSFSK